MIFVEQSKNTWQACTLIPDDSVPEESKSEDDADEWHVHVW